MKSLEHLEINSPPFGDSSYRSLVDTERVCGHPGKELPVMAPPEKKNISNENKHNTLNQVEVTEYLIAPVVEKERGVLT